MSDECQNRHPMNTQHLREMVDSAETYVLLARRAPKSINRLSVLLYLSLALFYLSAARTELRRLERLAR